MHLPFLSNCVLKVFHYGRPRILCICIVFSNKSCYKAQQGGLEMEAFKTFSVSLSQSSHRQSNTCICYNAFHHSLRKLPIKSLSSENSLSNPNPQKTWGTHNSIVCMVSARLLLLCSFRSRDTARNPNKYRNPVIRKTKNSIFFEKSEKPLKIWSF